MKFFGLRAIKLPNSAIDNLPRHRPKYDLFKRVFTLKKRGIRSYPFIGFLYRL